LIGFLPQGQGRYDVYTCSSFWGLTALFLIFYEQGNFVRHDLKFASKMFL